MQQTSSSKCYYVGCLKRPTYGIDLSRKRESCAEHARPGMVNIDLTRCARQNCETRATFGDPVSGRRKYCSKHAPPGMLNVERKKCARENCPLPPAYWHPQNRKRRCCVEHAEEGMVKLDKKLCPFKGCFTSASYGVPGQKKKRFCAAHAQPGMVSIGGRRCATEGCSKRANYGVEGTRNRQFCAEHARAGMVNINNQKPRAAMIIRRRAGGTAETASPRNRHAGTGVTGVVGVVGGGGGGGGSPGSTTSTASSSFDAGIVGFPVSAATSNHATDGVGVGRWHQRSGIDVGGAYLGVGSVGGGSRYAYPTKQTPAEDSFPVYAPPAASAGVSACIRMQALSYAAFGEDAASGGGLRAEVGSRSDAQDGVRQHEAGIDIAGSRLTGARGMEIPERIRERGGTAVSSGLERGRVAPPWALGKVDDEEVEEGEEGGGSTSSSSSVALPEPSRVLQPWPKSKQAPPLLLTSEGWLAWEWRPVNV
eukprot:g18688.t1